MNEPAIGIKNNSPQRLDALLDSGCGAEEFLQAVTTRSGVNADSPWETLAAVDQLYRRGKLSAHLYRAAKDRIGRRAHALREPTAPKPLEALRVSSIAVARVTPHAPLSLVTNSASASTPSVPGALYAARSPAVAYREKMAAIEGRRSAAARNTPIETVAPAIPAPVQAAAVVPPVTVAPVLAAPVLAAPVIAAAVVTQVPVVKVAAEAVASPVVAVQVAARAAPARHRWMRRANAATSVVLVAVLIGIAALVPSALTRPLNLRLSGAAATPMDQAEIGGSVVTSVPAVPAVPPMPVPSMAGGAPSLPGEINLTADRYLVYPGAERATIDILRTGGSSGQVGVEYTVVGLGAQAGKDYVYRGRHTLTIADGKYSAQIRVPILHNPKRKHIELFEVRIGHQSGGVTLGEAVRATVFILPP